MSTTKQDKNFSFILYEESKAPNYFEVNRPLLGKLLIALPLVAFISAAALLATAVYFKSISLKAELSEPRIMRELRTENLALQGQISKLQAETKLFESKLAQGSADSDLMPLNIFKAAPGMQDLTNNPAFSLDNFEAELAGGKVAIKFNIVNTTKENERLAGYIFVAMRSGDTLQLYPRGSFNPDDFTITFHRGESFVTSRFRPVELAFPLPEGARNALIKVVIFSRTGDILHKKTLAKNFTY